MVLLVCLDQRPGHGVADHHDRVDLVPLHGPPGFMGVELRQEHHSVTGEQGRERAPLRAAVDERCECQPHHASRAGAPAAALLPLIGQPLTGGEVDTSAERAPHVLVPPEHALGVSGRAAGIQQVDVVGTPLGKVPRRRLGRQRRSKIHRANGQRHAAAVVDREERAQIREVRQQRGYLVAVLPVEDQAFQFGLAEQVPQLRLDVPVVDIDRNSPQLVAREEGLDELDGVPAIDADVVAGADTGRSEVVR